MSVHYINKIQTKHFFFKDNTTKISSEKSSNMICLQMSLFFIFWYLTQKHLYIFKCSLSVHGWAHCVSHQWLCSKNTDDISAVCTHSTHYWPFLAFIQQYVINEKSCQVISLGNNGRKILTHYYSCHLFKINTVESHLKSVCGSAWPIYRFLVECEWCFPVLNQKIQKWWWHDYYYYKYS